MSHAWMPLYVADYLADTGHLSTLEHGAYMLLIMHYWQTGGLPDDDRKLARIARLQLDQWQEIRDTLADLFGPRWEHKRIDAELAHASDVISKRSAAAKAMHAKRNASAQREQCISDANAPAYAQQVKVQTGIPSPSPSPRYSDANASGEATSPPPPPASDPVDEAVGAYNLMAGEAGWPKAQRVTAARRAALKARLRECGGIEGWRAAMAKARASPFLMGDHDRDWRPGLDFFLQAKSFTKLMEGAYDRSSRPAAGQREPDRGPTQSERGRTLMAEVLAGRHDSRLSAAPSRPQSPVGPAEGGGSGDVLPFGGPPGTRVIR